VKEALLMLVRYPEPGQTKTKLIPGLGAEGAASLYRLMAGHVAGVVRSVERPDLLRMAYFAPAAKKTLVADWLGDGLDLSAQPEGNKGVKLEAGFARAFAKKAERVVAIGTDCVDVTADLIGEAFDSLAHADAILGPSSTGGVWLIGVTGLFPEMFRDIPWGSDRTFSALLKTLNGAGRNVHLLPELHEIDGPDDLETGTIRRLRRQAGA
jgi:rSAM/selenodomain-associated transferase 1